MKSVILASVLAFLGLLGVFLLLPNVGQYEWLALASWLMLAGSLVWLAVIARDARDMAVGYQRWRNAVWMVQLAVNEGRTVVRVDQLVSALADVTLMNSYDEGREQEAEWERGGHSER